MDIDFTRKIKDRIWYWRENDELPLKNAYEIKKRVTEVIDLKSSICCPISYIFLVDTPVTFGHSQLVMNFPCDACHSESACFNQAAPIIEKALSTFKQMLNPRTVNEFWELAEFTFTKKSYIKTLILRVSAQEDRGKEYKVHLVPYFESHACLCRKRYTAIHNVDRKKKGGLIGWLGERETIVEIWKNENVSLVGEIINDVWKLPELRELLAGA